MFLQNQPKVTMQHVHVAPVFNLQY